MIYYLVVLVEVVVPTTEVAVVGEGAEVTGLGLGVGGVNKYRIWYTATARNPQ